MGALIPANVPYGPILPDFPVRNHVQQSAQPSVDDISYFREAPRAPLADHPSPFRQPECILGPFDDSRRWFDAEWIHGSYHNDSTRFTCEIHDETDLSAIVRLASRQGT